MSATDWMLLCVVGVSALLGLVRGFVGMVLSLVGWVLAGWSSLHFGPQMGPWLASPAPPGPAHIAAGYAVCFGGVVLLMGGINLLVRWGLKSAGLSGIDRMLGLAIGSVRGGVAACFIVLLMGMTPLPYREDWQRSWVIAMLVPGAEVMRDWLPQWAAQRVDFGYGRVVRGA